MKKSRNYTTLIFDADHTLIDYGADERAAFRRQLPDYGIVADEKTVLRCQYLSETTWTEAGLYDVHSERVQREYHRLYRSHVALLFARIFAEFPPAKEVSPKAAGERFLRELEHVAGLISGAEEVLSALSDKTGGKYRVCVATNGVNSIQTGRLKALNKYFERVYISEDVGQIKPLPAFFEYVLSDINERKENCLMIGDSLSSDVAGALGVGLDCCWFNPTGKTNETAFIPTYEIRALIELLSLL